MPALSYAGQERQVSMKMCPLKARNMHTCFQTAKLQCIGRASSDHTQLQDIKAAVAQQKRAATVR